MNIKDLAKGSYTVEDPKTLNINSLPKDSYTIDQSSATLAHSQQAIDQLRAKQQQDEQAAQVANAPATIAKETVKGTVGGLFDPLIKGARSVVQGVGEAFGAKPTTDQYTGLAGTPQQTLQTDVTQGKSVPAAVGELALDAASVLPIGKGATLAKNAAKGVLESKAASPIINAIKKPITAVSDFMAKRAATKADTKAIETLQQTISPKMDSKEVKLALKDGRIIPGRDPGLLRGGTPDTIMPSEKTTRAAQTIHGQIPGASGMKAPELHSAIDTQVKNMGQSLRPVMESTPIGENTVAKISNDWEALKAKQLADPYAPATANVEKLQADFEKNFLQKSKSGNFGDLWDTRIAYDASVPSSVKNANSLSSETLQTQKELWLQNREILNGAINDASSGLGEVSQKTFHEMNDMYNAQRGIESSFKPAKEGAASKTVQFAKDHPYVTGAALYGANKAVKDTTGVGIPIP